VTGWRRWLSIVTGHDHTFLGGMSLLDHPWVQEADILHLHNLHGYYFHLPAVGSALFMMPRSRCRICIDR
jgi:hypothetical protein